MKQNQFLPQVIRVNERLEVESPKSVSLDNHRFVKNEQPLKLNGLEPPALLFLLEGHVFLYYT